MIFKKKLTNFSSLTPILRDTDLKCSKLLKLRAYRVIFPTLFLLLSLVPVITLAQSDKLPFGNPDDWLDSTLVNSKEIRYYYKGDTVINDNLEFDSNTNLSYIERLGPNTLKIYSAPAFVKDTNGLIREIESATTTQTLFNEQYDLLLNEKISFWKTAHAQTFTTNTDASTYSSGTGSTWDSARQDTYGDAMDTSKCFAGGGKNGYWYMWRCLLQFNVSAIPDTAIIGTSSIFLWADTKWDNDNDGNDLINIVGNYATTTPYATYHYNDIGSDNGQPDRASTTPIYFSIAKDITSLSTGVYSEWSLNSNATSTVATSTYLNIGVREGHDYLNDPYANYVDASKASFYNYTQTGTANDPYVIINYTEAMATTTPSATTTACALSAIEFDNSLSSVNYQSEIYSASGSLLTVEYGKYNIPILAWIVLVVPFVWIMGRVILEILIRLRA